ncbi:MAG: hypothetical protein V3W41_08085 [Planctomycetota bacterium]
MAQSEPLIVGFSDYLDERSQAKGMARCLQDVRGIEAIQFDPAKTASLDARQCDVVVLSSFVERHRNWNRFWRAQSKSVYDMVRRGGVLIAFCRYRKADDPSSPDSRLRLEPPGYEVARGKLDPKMLYVEGNSHPIWDSFAGRGDARGIKSLKSTRVADRKRFALDCFDSWDTSKWKVGISSDRRVRRGDAAALQARYGRGEIILLQLILDKAEGANADASDAVRRDLFANIFRWAKSRPRLKKPAKRQPKVVPDPKQGGRQPLVPLPVVVPKDPKPRRVDPPKIFERLRIDGRVFLDANRNGFFDAGERVFFEQLLSDQVKTWKTGGDGRYQVDVQRTGGRSFYLEIPGGFEMLDKRPWYRDITGPDARATLRLDFPLVPRRSEPSSTSEGKLEDRVLFVRVPNLESSERSAAFERALQEMILVHRPRDLVVMVVDIPTSSLLKTRMTFDRILRATGLPIYVAVPNTGRLQGVGNSSLAGPERFSRGMRNGKMVFLGRNRLPTAWRLWATRQPQQALLVSGELLMESSESQLAGRILVAPARDAADLSQPDRPRVPSFSVPGSKARALLMTWRKSQPPRFELLGGVVTARVPAGDSGQKTGAKEEPAKQPDPAPKLDLPPHPLIQGSLEAALEAALRDS